MSYDPATERRGNGIIEGFVPAGGGTHSAYSNDSHVDVIGQSPAMQETCSMAGLVADSMTPVLITGESGTGKDVIARLIHAKSRRAKMPFVAINCAAVPRDVFENELFGHEYGAFTGARSKKIGFLEMAHGGILFLDELAEMAPETQAKLLRVIETKAFRRLGGSQEMHADVRMLAATNKNVSQAIQSGELRRDLYYRFSVIELFLAPLRERKEDIPLLLEYFLTLFCGKHSKARKYFTEDSLRLLEEYDWPGNVRELRNVVERAVIISSSDSIKPDHLPGEIAERVSPRSNFIVIPVGTSLKEAEKKLILQTLASSHNNKSRTACMLGMTRKGLYTKLKRYGSFSPSQK